VAEIQFKLQPYIINDANDTNLMIKIKLSLKSHKQRTWHLDLHDCRPFGCGVT